MKHSFFHKIVHISIPAGYIYINTRKLVPCSLFSFNVTGMYYAVSPKTQNNHYFITSVVFVTRSIPAQPIHPKVSAELQDYNHPFTSS